MKEFLRGRVPRSIEVNQWEDLRVITIAESAKFPFGAVRAGTEHHCGAPGIVGCSAEGRQAADVGLKASR